MTTATTRQSKYRAPDVDTAAATDIDDIDAPMPALLDRIAADAATVDSSGDEAVVRRALERLWASGLFEIDHSDPDASLRDHASMIADLAARCMSTAFAAWAHRMTVHYVAIGRPESKSLREELATVSRPGSSALADAFRARAGVAPLAVHAVDQGSHLVLNGDVRWASNLHPDTIIVTAAQVSDSSGATRQAIVAVDAGTDGVDVQRSIGLLALDATASGSISFHRARIPSDRAFTIDAGTFLTLVQPAFLILQTAFCLGLVEASTSSTAEQLDRSLMTSTFAATYRDVKARAEDVWATVADVTAAKVAGHGAAAHRRLIQMRLDAARLARDATAMELCVTGGRGYALRHPAARRLREAAFLPVQSPTEGQLRWELSQSN